MQLWHSTVVTLMTSATAAVASLDGALPYACMRIYVCTPILYNTLSDCAYVRSIPAMYTATAAALVSVCLSVCQR